MKPQSELTKSNGSFRHPVFWTNSSKVETKMFQAIHHKVKSKKGSLFGKTQNTCVELTRRLGEHLGTKCYKCKENSSFQSDQFIEKLTNGSKVKGKFRPKISVERQSQNCTNCQMLQSLFQKGTKLTNSFSKLGTKWPNIGKNRMNDKKVPFKMKRKVVIGKSGKTNVKMKVISKQVKFGKPKWKIKFGI
jgi:hypothetical protein